MKRSIVLALLVLAAVSCRGREVEEPEGDPAVAACIEKHGRAVRRAAKACARYCDGKPPISREAALCIARAAGVEDGVCGLSAVLRIGRRASWFVDSLEEHTPSSRRRRFVRVDPCSGSVVGAEGSATNLFGTGSSRYDPEGRCDEFPARDPCWHAPGTEPPCDPELWTPPACER
jgi:hypothetical protein